MSSINLIKLFAFLIERGRPFQNLGAALAKDPSPKIFFVPVVNRDLKQTTTATATRTWKNKRSNWQNNSPARAF